MLANQNGLPRVLSSGVSAVLFALILFFPQQASAHKLGEGYIFLDVTEAGVSGRVEVTLEELDSLFGIEADQDGKISDEELLPFHDAASAYVFERFGVGSEEGWFVLNPTDVTTESYPLGRYAFFHFETAGQLRTPQVLRLRYEVMFDQDERHRGLLVVENNVFSGQMGNHTNVSLIFSPESAVQTVDLMGVSMHSVLATFLRHGTWHIGIGIDHILFLAVLLLPSVMLYRNDEWQPVGGFKPALWSVAKIVTLFTLAHSITLSLAVLGVVNMPPTIVESVIAASIVVAAVLNLIPKTAKALPVTIFVFGLFHGFGFASVLGHLTTQTGSLLPALLGFNAGVELGQLLIVLVLLPLLYLLRRSRFYKVAVLNVGSAIIALVACVWFVERMFGLEPILGL